MFRRNPFAKGSSSSPPGDDGSYPPIPEHEQPPSTPIPERPTLFTSDSWQDPNEPRSASWTSQAAAYDINPKYTTANQSYTHRRRKSSMITNLIAGSNDPYQSTYQDWRDSVASPESLRPRKTSWSLFGRRKSRHLGRRRSKCGKITRLLAMVLLLVTVVISGMWLFGGPLPLVSVHDLKMPGSHFRVADVNWPKWEVERYLDKVKPKQKWIGSQVNKWTPESIKRAAIHWNGVAEPINIQTDNTALPTISVGINPDLKAFGVETLKKVTVKATPTLTSSESSSNHATVVGEPVAVRSEAVSDLLDSGASNIEEAVVTDDVDAETQAHQRRSEAMWKKYADISPNNDHLDDTDATQSFAGTLADGVSPSTET